MIFWSLTHGFDLETGGLAALQWLFKATAVLLVALLLDRSLRGRFVLACAAMWNAMLVLLAALPIAALLLPIWTFAVTTPQEITAVEAAAVKVPPQTAQPITPIFVQPLPIEEVLGNKVEPPPATQPVPRTPAAELPKPAPPVQQYQYADLLGPTLAAIYLVGCSIACWRLIVSMRSVTRLRKSSTLVEDPDWLQDLARWRERCDLQQEIELRQSSDAEVPLLLGWRQPLIVLPREVAESSDQRTRNAVLIHELAHVARGDFAWQLFLRGVRAMLWFHPLMWWAERRIGVVRERACDAYTIHRLEDSAGYIAMLLEMAGRLTRRGSLSLGLAVLRTSQLGERLAAMRDSSGSPRCQAGKAVRLAALVTALLLAGWGGRVALGEPMLPRVSGLTVDAQNLLDEFEGDAKGLRAEAERQIAAKRAELEVELRALQTHYTRSDNLDAAVAIRDQIRLLKAAAKFGDKLPTIYNDPGNMVSVRAMVGQTFYLSVTGSNRGSIWGTDAYTDDSTVAVAAVHAGVLKLNQTGIVKVTMLPPRPSYIGSQRNGVDSGNFTNDGSSANPPGKWGQYATYTIERSPEEIISLSKSVAPVDLPATPTPLYKNVLSSSLGNVVTLDLQTNPDIFNGLVTTSPGPLPKASTAVPDAFKAELKQAEVQVQNAKASLQAASTAVQRAEANLQRCQAERAFREKRSQRLELLRGQKAVDEDTVDEALFQLRSAQATEDLARVDFNAAKTQSTLATEQLQQAEAELKEVQAKIEAMKALHGASGFPPIPGAPGSSDASVISKAMNYIARQQTIASSPPTMVLQAPRNLTAFRQNVGHSYLFYLPSAAAPLSMTQHINGATREVTTTFDGTVWGTDIYTDDSALDVAAVHAGLLAPGLPTVVRATILPGQPSYDGSTRHGVTSSSYSGWGGSYRIEKPTAADYRRINEMSSDSTWRDTGEPATPVHIELKTPAATAGGPPRRAMSQHPVQREFTPFEDFAGRLVALDQLPADRRPADSIAVRFAVDERSYRHYQALRRTGKAKGPGDPLAVALSDENGFPRAASVEHFEHEFDPNTGTIGVLGALSNPDGLLLPGMYVRVRMKFGPPRLVLEVPADAVVHREQGQSYVWVVDEQGIVQQRIVRPGATDAESQMVVIEEGIAPDDRVVVEGTAGLKPGDRISAPSTEPAP